MKLRYVLLILLGLSACLTPSSKPSCLRISFNNHPTTVDPRKSGDFTSASLICLIYEGLTRCGPKEKIDPALAYKIDISPDGTTYTFHLRKTFWTDGTPVTAFDFEKSWKKSIDPSFPCLSSFLFFPIQNVEKYVRGEACLEEVGIKVLTPQTLQVQLEKPTPYFLSLTAFPIYLPIPAHIEEKNKNWDQEDNSQLICNGPFQIKKTVLNSEILLIKNQRFWNKKNIRLDSIHISILSDETTAFQMFEKGDLDFIGGPLSPLPADALNHLQNKASIHFIPMDASTFCTFNTQTYPFYNSSLRKAFSYAIDRKAIIQNTLQTGQIPAESALPETLFSPLQKNRKKEKQTDLKAAQNFLKQGLKELNISVKELENITLYHKQGQDPRRLAQTLQKTWKETLGVTLKIEQLEPKSHLEKLHKKNYQIALASWICQFHDPVSVLDRFRFRENAKNYPGWQSKEYALQLDKASLCINPEERENLLKIAEEIFCQATPIAPLYHWTSPCISHPRLKKVATTPSGGILFERFEIEEIDPKRDHKD